jgi:diphthamide synthase (EF-2-diphthine--ammonia ligase)
MNVRRAAVSFTGGKDCTLCLHRALKDNSISVVLLVTFAPINSKPCKAVHKKIVYFSYTIFHLKVLAHPMHIIEAQSVSLGIPHKVIFIQAPFLDSYQEGIQKLWDEHQIELLFTGKHVFILDFLVFFVI